MIEIRAFIPNERYKDVELPVVKGLTFVLYDDTFNIPENFTNTVFISANGLKEDENMDSFNVIYELVMLILGDGKY